MKPTEQLQFNVLNLAGVKTLVDWAEKEGWNPGPHDAEAFYNTDPNGFYGYFLGDELIGGGSLVSYNGHFGFMGFFIIQPKYRGSGLGKELWYLRRDTLLVRLQPGAAIGMDGVVAMQPFYQKGGFEIAFKDERYERLGQAFETDPHISSITPEDYPLIREMDTECFGFDRWNFMQHWLAMPNLKAFKMVVNNRLLGFALLRKAAVGYKICPLFAEDFCVAEELYKACLNAAVDQPVYIDIPMCNPAAIELTRKYNAHYVFECARMYYGTPPQIAVEKIFGLTSFELG
jgi:GNAT superfamily N-acetyltransferase